MLGFLNLRRQRLAGLESEADRLIDLTGSAAYQTASRMSREANDYGTMRYWTSVRDIVARKNGPPAHLDHSPQGMFFGRPLHDGFDVEAAPPTAGAPPLHAILPAPAAEAAQRQQSASSRRR